MLTIPERLKIQTEVLKKALDQHGANLRVAAPGIVQAFNATKQTVTVQLAIRERVIDGKGNLSWVEIPILLDVPVYMPRAGGFALTLPVTAGDECLVIFGDTCMDAWWQTGGVQNQMERRRHDLSDGYALLGVWSQPRKITGYATGSVQLRSLEEATFVEVTSSEVNVEASGDVSATAGAALSLEAADSASLAGSDVQITGPDGVTIDGGGSTEIDSFNFLLHTHAGIYPGHKNSGPVATGAGGLDDPVMVWKGVYDNAAPYSKGEVVLYSGNLWMSLEDTNTGNPPAKHSTHWQLASEVDDVTPPTPNPPTGMASTVTTSTVKSIIKMQAVLSCNVCTDASGKAVKYEFQLWKTGETGNVLKFTTKDPSITVKDLDPGTTYYWKVASFDYQVNYTDFCADQTISVTSTVTAPAAPTNLDLKTKPGGFKLKWTKSTSKSAFEYRIYVNTANNDMTAKIIARVAHPETKKELYLGDVTEDGSITLTAGTTYHWWIAVADELGNVSAMV